MAERSELPRVAVAAPRAQNQLAAVRRAGGLLQAEAALSRGPPPVTKGEIAFGEDSLAKRRSRAQQKGTPYAHTSYIGIFIYFLLLWKEDLRKGSLTWTCRGDDLLNIALKLPEHMICLKTISKYQILK